MIGSTANGKCGGECIFHFVSVLYSFWYHANLLRFETLTVIGIVLLRSWSLLMNIKRFDLFMQGSLVIVILMETNAYLLLRRDAGTGRLNSLMEEWVYMGCGLGEFLLAALLGWCHTGRRQLAMAAWLFATALAGLVVIAFPFATINPPGVELCGGETITAYSEFTWDEPTPRTVVIILTALLCSLSRLSIFAHGFTYLDDHEPQDGTYFFGILVCIRATVGISGENWLRVSAMRENWWEVQVSLSMLMFMFSALFALFPPKMPQYKEVEITNSPDLVPSVIRILKNKVLMVQVAGLTFINAALFGFARFDSAFVQARYQVESLWADPRTSSVTSDVFRSLIIIFFVMIFRTRFSGRRQNGVKATTAARVGGIVALFSAVFFVVLTVLPCDTGNVVGLHDGNYDAPSCSNECGCSIEKYGFTPVCAVDSEVTYFSPCSAGCTQYQNYNGLILFENCTCAPRAVRGTCELPSCSFIFAFYEVFFTLTIAISAAAMVMQGMVLVRTVHRWDKPVAVSVGFGIIALLFRGPGRLFYLFISYLTCVFENAPGGMCVFHGRNLWWIAACSAIFCVVSAGFSLLASRLATTKLARARAKTNGTNMTNATNDTNHANRNSTQQPRT